MPGVAYKVILYYKYVNIENPEELMNEQKNLCHKLGLKGRIILAKEGINGTLEGLQEEIDMYCKDLKSKTEFSDIKIKISDGDGKCFPKLSIKVRDEIVSTHLNDKNIDPNKLTGKYLAAEELNKWFVSKKEFYIIDMRNQYEHAIGHFENSVLPQLGNFRDLPKVLPELEHLQNKTVVTVCTGGIRCEKASGFLIENGFKDVYQLKDGIVTYMEKYPNQRFKGKLYVFDQRIAIGFNTGDPKHEIIGICEKCGKSSESYINCSFNGCHRHFICCANCWSADGLYFCNKKCEKSFKKQETTLKQIN